MNKFKLNIGQLIQGKLNLRTINIAFVFQVNCPGCFIYGFPTMNILYEQFKDSVGFAGISTAFEDFEHNTEENTERLLSKGITVGETKKYLTAKKIDSYLHLPSFPIAFDKMSTAKDFLTDENLSNLLSLLTESTPLSMAEQEKIKQRIRHYYSNHPVIAETFTLNQLRGTPSFIIYKENYEIIHASFGHQSEQVLSEILQKNLF